MNVRTGIILLLLLGTLLYGGHRWACHITNACCKSSCNKAIAENVTTKWSTVDVERNKELFPAFKDNLLAEFDKKKNVLKITGLYYPDEEYNGKFENLGLARADQIRRKMFDRGYRKSIHIDSRMLEGTIEDKESAFKAADFDKVDFESMAARVEERDGKIIFYFPFNSDDPKINPNIRLYLSEMVEDMKDGNDAIYLSGHTDNVGEDDVNMGVSQQRADAIKTLLVSYGIDEGRITTEAFGETQPQADNDTDRGRALNRRVELILNK